MTMFSKRDYLIFVTAIVLITLGYLCMVFDQVENGFGIATLWIAPPVLLTGFILPVVGILGADRLSFLHFVNQVKLNLWKHLFGFFTFLIAFITYLITLEPTASLWDCSEFIASAFKLQVPHTPGAPLFLLIGRIFSMLSLGDVKLVAWSINLMSALFSAMTVYILFYVIYIFGKKAFSKASFNTMPWLVLASVTSSLCLTFSDTFWFSAVEAETYGAASFFLLLLVWMIVKGTNLKEPLRSRWIILIFYVSGLAYCIHPMCLLALPLLPFMWVINQQRVSATSTIISIVAGLAMVLFINRFVAVGLFELVFAFDLFFVNSVHMPFYSGLLILILFLIVIFSVCLKKYKSIQAYTWAFIFLIVGFAPYLMLFIRSNHNPPIDETNPENLPMIKAYMNRESYGSHPLVYGPYFDAPIIKVSTKKKIYHKTDERYEVSGIMHEYHFDESRKTILPRLHSNDADHIESYRSWTGLKPDEKPKFSDNLKFMLRYQSGHMYVRYLLWNFSGRESDEKDSDWLKPWDSLYRTTDARYESQARNQYFMLPLILGIAGMFFQFSRDRKNFLAVLLFFFITGFLLVLYLNSSPNEPRERDYIYVGSYIAFCIWIGLGVLALCNYLPTRKGVFSGIVTIAIGVPCWMLYQNYDDHNRAGRTFQVDNARNLLNSCAPNSILFTGGDNDTFPLWYLQEVEGCRTDVRVMVLSYLNTDWYINQLRKGYYSSAPFELSLDEKDYRQYGPNDVLYLQETIKDGIDVKKYLELLKHEHKGLRVYTATGDYYNILPSKILKIQVNPQKMMSCVAESIPPSHNIAPEMELRVTGNYLQKSGLAILDIIISNNWERPIYFNFTSLNTAGLELNPHVVQEGSAYRLLPIVNSGNEIAVNTQLMYQNLVQKSDYDNLSVKGINFNFEDYHARIITPLRQSFNTLAIALIQNGEILKAEEVLEFAVEKLYPPQLRPSYTNLQAADILQSLGREDLAKLLSTSVFDFHFNFLVADLNKKNEVDRMDLFVVKQSAELLNRMGDGKYLSMFDALPVTRKPAMR